MGYDHGRIFRALAFVDVRAKAGISVSSSPTAKARGELAVFRIKVVDVADMAVVRIAELRPVLRAALT